MAVLKRAISRLVTQTSRRGADGNRDAVLYGQGTGDWATQPWRSWVFQFKQYEDDTTATRARALADYRSEGAKVFKADPKWDVYFFLTSVSFSGVPGTGLFDRVAAATAELKKQFRRDAVFWDANELLNWIDLHAPDYAPFFESTPSASHPSIVVAPDTSSSRLVIVEDITDRLLVESRIDELLPDKEPILGPGSRSPLWILANAGRWQSVQSFTRRALRAIHRRRRVDVRLDCWLTVIAAWSEAHLGAIRASIRQLDALKQRRRINRDRELAAWVANVRAICAGKGGNEAMAEAFAHRAVTLAEESGNYWLAHSVVVRQLHRESWHAWEEGVPMVDDDFHERLQAASAYVPYADAEARDSMLIANLVAAILQQSWRPTLASLTQTSIAQLLANPLLPTDEQARLTSEYGRVSLYGATDHESAVEWLRRAVTIRAASGHKPRLRYDLVWLADAYLAIGNRHLAKACAIAAERIHQQLYGNLLTDAALVTQLRFIMAATSSVSIRELGRLLEMATGVIETWWRIEINSDH
jgi:tetratricopeptide (TPR) repeat protein